MSSCRGELPDCRQALFPGGLSPMAGSHSCADREARLVVVCLPSHRFVCSKMFIAHLRSVSSCPGAEEKTMRQTQEVTVLMELALYGCGEVVTKGE